MSTSLFAPLQSKLARLGLTAEEQSLFLAGVASTRRCAAGEPVVQQGEAAPDFIGLLNGLAARFKIGPDGTRQILAFCIPGDLCTAQVSVSGEMDHGIIAISRCTFAVVPARTITALVKTTPKLAMAFWRDTVADAAVEREWLFNIGRRSAHARIAHLLCEVQRRLEIAGLARPGSFDFPVTQSDVADAMGLSTVHVNRSVRALKEAGLATLKGGQVTIGDREGLSRAAGFDDGYLDLECRRASPPTPTRGRNSSGASDARM